MTQIRRIGVLSAAKVVGILFTVNGLIAGLFLACFSLVGLAAEYSSDAENIGVAFFVLFGLCVLPLLYGIVGAISGALLAVIYNVVARPLGGLEVELVETQKTTNGAN